MEEKLGGPDDQKHGRSDEAASTSASGQIGKDPSKVIENNNQDPSSSSSASDQGEWYVYLPDDCTQQIFSWLGPRYI